MNLEMLRSAMEPLKKFGQEELTFDVPDGNGTQISVSLRALLPREEIFCQTRAGEILRQAQEGRKPDEDIERATALSYFDSFRIEVIAFAICQIGSSDFRNLKAIETGETLENGTPVRIPLQKALRDLITEGWSRGMITICFSKYGDLVSRIAEKADRVVESSVADLDAEIQRLEQRLTSVKSERESRAKGDPSVTTEHIKSLVQFGEGFEEDVQATLVQVQNDRMVAEEFQRAKKEEQDNKRKPVIPKTAPPPTSVPEETPPVDNADFDAIFAAREEANKASADALQSEGVSRAVPAGSVQTKDGSEVEAFRLPTETLSPRGKKSPKGKGKKRGKPSVDTEPSTRGTQNPNFKPRG